jgi:uncharacterized membrane protein (UPF0127 family)
MKKFRPLLFFIPFFLLILFFVFNLRPSEEAIQTLVINGQRISIEVVSRTPDLIRGLSGREFLPKDGGMLFVFPDSQKYGIWMKEMNFPLDIIWFSDDWKIVYIKENARPESYPELFKPTALAKFVLEVNSGFVADYGIKVGDSGSLSQ